MARPKKTNTMDVLSIRVPKSMVEQIDRYTEKLREETPLLAINRTDTIRYLLARMLSESSAPPKRAKRTKR